VAAISIEGALHAKACGRSGPGRSSTTIPSWPLSSRGVAVARTAHRVSVDPQRDVVQEWAAVDLSHVNPALEPRRERIERSEQVMPGDPHIEREVISRPGGKADERQIVLCRRSGDCRQRAVTAGHAQRVGSRLDGYPNDRREIVSRAEHDRLDASFACSISEGGPRRLAVARSRIDYSIFTPS
jgi:hypothetical protein